MRSVFLLPLSFFSRIVLCDERLICTLNGPRSSLPCRTHVRMHLGDKKVLHLLCVNHHDVCVNKPEAYREARPEVSEGKRHKKKKKRQSEEKALPYLVAMETVSLLTLLLGA